MRNKVKGLLAVVLVGGATGLAFSSARARRVKLSKLGIHSVYLYSRLIRSDDAVAQREASWVHEALSGVMQWKVVNKVRGADAIVILVPHGEGYQIGASSSCSSADGGLTCTYGDGSSFNVDCSVWGCDSFNNPGNYLSLAVAVPAGAPTSRTVRLVWKSDAGLGGAVTRSNIGLLDSGEQQDQALQMGVSALCHAAGIGGRWKCSFKVDHSWKAWERASRSDGQTVTLPR